MSHQQRRWRRSTPRRHTYSISDRGHGETRCPRIYRGQSVDWKLEVTNERDSIHSWHPEPYKPQTNWNQDQNKRKNRIRWAEVQRARKRRATTFISKKRTRFERDLSILDCTKFQFSTLSSILELNRNLREDVMYEGMWTLWNICIRSKQENPWLSGQNVRYRP